MGPRPMYSLLYFMIYTAELSQTKFKHNKHNNIDQFSMYRALIGTRVCPNTWAKGSRRGPGREQVLRSHVNINLPSSPHRHSIMRVEGSGMADERRKNENDNVSFFQNILVFDFSEKPSVTPTLFYKTSIHNFTKAYFDPHLR